MKLPWWKKILYGAIAVPFITFWMLTHPKEVWAQAKTEFKEAWRKS